MIKLLKHTPIFLFLLPVFFVLHGYTENFGFINISNCLVLTVTYSGATAFVYFLFLLLYKNYIKAAADGHLPDGFLLFLRRCS